MVSVRVGSLFLSAPAQRTSEPELGGGGGGGTSYNVLYEEKNIHINKKKKNSKEKSDLRLADISDGQALLLHGI